MHFFHCCLLSILQASFSTVVLIPSLGSTQSSTPPGPRMTDPENFKRSPLNSGRLSWGVTWLRHFPHSLLFTKHLCDYLTPEVCLPSGGVETSVISQLETDFIPWRWGFKRIFCYKVQKESGKIQPSKMCVDSRSNPQDGLHWAVWLP